VREVAAGYSTRNTRNNEGDFMINVTEGAFIELPKGESPPFHSLSRCEEGTYREFSPEGLEVSWPDDSEIPNSAQVYLTWEPKVYAVWED